MRTWSWATLVLGCLACSGGGGSSMPDAPVGGVDAAGDAAIDAPGGVGDILDELRAIPGLTVTERSTMITGYRFFTMTYDQPVDHANPGGQRFQQRMTLLHHDYAAPMVVYNSGYFVSQRGGRAEITRLVIANQLSMEYRYFAPSRPEPTDWSKLDIQQAASDQHRITEALKARLYRGKWLTTGASKGGMTSLFHRRFFPAEVDATVAYVAPFDYPEDAVQSPTNRYIAFLENVGTDPGCRQALKDFQNLVLARKDAMKAQMRGVATFTEILGEDRALEFAAEELPFIFWQYGDQSNCASIPDATASDATVFQFFDNVISVASYGDADLTDFLPYYHQSATQLGYPISDESYLVGLQFPGQDTAQAYLPASIPTPTYDQGAAMRDVQGWLAASGERVLLIYGENDPWSAGAVELGAATDSFKFISPGGNHGSAIATLAGGDQAAAVAAVRRWAGVSAKQAAPLDPAERTAEQDELEFMREHRLR
jgi:hypothetical protein